MTNATPGELRWKIRKARLDHRPRLNAAAIAELTRVSIPTVRAYESGQRRIPDEWVARYAEVLILPPEWFYDGDATEPPYPPAPKIPRAKEIEQATAGPIRLVPYFGTVPAGNWGGPPEEPDWVAVSADIDDHEIVAVRVTGDSMLPRLSHGQLVIVRLSKDPRDGVITLLQNQDNELTLKVPRYAEGKGWTFNAINPEYPSVTAERVSILGYAVGVEEINNWGIRP